MIRASEIGTYLYCHRAWSYQARGVEADNLAELVAGRELHERHVRLTLTSGCLRFLAYTLLLAAIVLTAIVLTGKLLAG
ncbi:MAG: hypothetical protein PHS96_07905 [Anaerolineales bacterium]|nr:hypothetical protein [Anaerolineales bacterium]